MEKIILWYVTSFPIWHALKTNKTTLEELSWYRSVYYSFELSRHERTWIYHLCKWLYITNVVCTIWSITLFLISIITDRDITEPNSFEFAISLRFRFYEHHNYALFSTERVNNTRLAIHHSGVPFKKWKLRIEHSGVSWNSKKTGNHNVRFQEINLAKLWSSQKKRDLLFPIPYRAINFKSSLIPPAAESKLCLHQGIFIPYPAIFYTHPALRQTHAW
jgi:hypothetical protein